ncbi:hypothetical protein MW887_005908 [Aspergillus wentii]|nr:hypothetical protein MW887_005908 [Aspergillus wentii]
MFFQIFQLWLLSFTLGLSRAQMKYEPDTNSLFCSKPGGSYCASASLKGSTMISCASSSFAQIRSCNVELAKILPGGYESTAVCYESSPDSGDAVCVFNGTGYTLIGSKIHIPETILCDTASPEIEPVSLLERSIPEDETKNGSPMQTATGTSIPLSQLSPSASANTAIPPKPLIHKHPICSNPWPFTKASPTEKAAGPGLLAPMLFTATSNSYETSIPSQSSKVLPSVIEQNKSGGIYTPITDVVTIYNNPKTTVYITSIGATRTVTIYPTSGMDGMSSQTIGSSPSETSISLAVSQVVNQLDKVSLMVAFGWFVAGFADGVLIWLARQILSNV